MHTCTSENKWKKQLTKNAMLHNQVHHLKWYSWMSWLCNSLHRPPLRIAQQYQCNLYIVEKHWQQFKVIQGWFWYQSLYSLYYQKFLLVTNSNFGPILHCFWDTVTYWLKIVYFSYPSLIWCPHSLCSLSNFVVKLSIRKLVMGLLCGEADMLSRQRRQSCASSIPCQLTSWSSSSSLAALYYQDVQHITVRGHSSDEPA